MQMQFFIHTLPGWVLFSLFLVAPQSIHAQSKKVKWQVLAPSKVTKSPVNPKMMMNMLKQKKGLPVSTKKSFSSLTKKQQSRYLGLLQLIIAPCCFTQPIALHSSGKSDQVKKDLQKRILMGQSDEEIKKAYVKQYGDRILAIPPHQDIIWFPIIGSILIALFFFFAVKKWSQQTPSPTN